MSNLEYIGRLAVAALVVGMLTGIFMLLAFFLLICGLTDIIRAFDWRLIMALVRFLCTCAVFVGLLALVVYFGCEMMSQWFGWISEEG